MARLADWAAVRSLRIAAWWPPMTRDVPSSRESVRTEVHTLEEVWLSSADLIGVGDADAGRFDGEGEEGAEVG